MDLSNYSKTVRRGREKRKNNRKSLYYIKNDPEVIACPNPDCPDHGPIYKHDLRERKYSHVDSKGDPVNLILYHQRYRCKSCGEVFLVDYDPPEGNNTDEFIKRIYELDYIERVQDERSVLILILVSQRSLTS